METSNTPQWVKDAIFYQIFPERFANGDKRNDPPNTVPWDSKPTRDNFFGGDIQGIIEKLPYLEELGINAIYLNPVFKAETNHKYDTCDYFAIDPSLGSQESIAVLVKEAHKRNIRVIFDAVFNHCGEGFWAFQDIKTNGSNSKYNDWFFINSHPIISDPPNYQTCGDTSYLPKLNTTNPEVEKHLLDAATYWIKQTDIDGWRLDVPWKTHLEFWRKFRSAVKRIKPEAYIVGEVWRGPEDWLNGNTCDGVMNYPLREYILDYCVRDHMDAEDFDYELGRLRNIHGDTAPYQLNLLGSHDTPRIRTLCNQDSKRLILALVFQFTYIGAPMVYYGDEIGLTGENDPDCRKTMPWTSSKWDQNLLRTHKTLISIRNKFEVLRHGNFESLFIFNSIFAYRRYLDEQEIIIILNPRKGRERISIPLKNQGNAKRWRDILTNAVFSQLQGKIIFDEIEANCAYILVPESI